MREFSLPKEVMDLVDARNKVSDYYHKVLDAHSSEAKLKFTLDGNLIGDIGEAIAVQLFGIQLSTRKSAAGIDGYTRDGKYTVQVKATGTSGGPAFRNTEPRAKYLIFFDLDLINAKGTIVFNGPEHYAFAKLKPDFKNQRSLRPKQIRDADQEVPDEERLPRLPDNDGDNPAWIRTPRNGRALL